MDLTHECLDKEQRECGEKVTCVHQCQVQDVSSNATIQHCRCFEYMLLFSWPITIFDLNCGDSTLTFHFYRIDLESDRGFLEEGSRKLTFWIYLISRTVFNIFMKTSYNIAVLLQISAFFFPTFERQIAP